MSDEGKPQGRPSYALAVRYRPWIPFAVILAGLLPTSGGEALLRGTPIARPRRDIGVVFQSPVLFHQRLGFLLSSSPLERLDRMACSLITGSW